MGELASSCAPASGGHWRGTGSGFWLRRGLAFAETRGLSTQAAIRVLSLAGARKLIYNIPGPTTGTIYSAKAKVMRMPPSRAICARRCSTINTVVACNQRRGRGRGSIFAITTAAASSLPPGPLPHSAPASTSKPLQAPLSGLISLWAELLCFNRLRKAGLRVAKTC